MNVLRLLNFPEFRYSGNSRMKMEFSLRIFYSIFVHFARLGANQIRFQEFPRDMWAYDPEPESQGEAAESVPVTDELLKAISDDIELDHAEEIHVIDCEVDEEEEELPKNELRVYARDNDQEYEVVPAPSNLQNALAEHVLSYAGIGVRETEGVGSFRLEFLLPDSTTVVATEVSVTLSTEDGLRHMVCKISPLEIDLDAHVCAQGTQCSYLKRWFPARMLDRLLLGDRCESACRGTDCPVQLSSSEYEHEFKQALYLLLHEFEIGSTVEDVEETSHGIDCVFEDAPAAPNDSATVKQVRVRISTGDNQTSSARRIHFVKLWARLDLGVVSAQEGHFSLSFEVRNGCRSLYHVLARTDSHLDNGVTRETATLLITREALAPTLLRV